MRVTEQIDALYMLKLIQLISYPAYCLLLDAANFDDYVADYRHDWGLLIATSLYNLPIGVYRFSLISSMFGISVAP